MSFEYSDNYKFVIVQFSERIIPTHKLLPIFIYPSFKFCFLCFLCAPSPITSLFLCQIQTLVNGPHVIAAGQIRFYQVIDWHRIVTLEEFFKEKYPLDEHYAWF